jgi:type II secretory pathway component PulF
VKFRYQAFDKSGAARSDVIEAPGQPEAMELLRREGLFVSQCAPAPGDAETPRVARAGRAGLKARTRGGRLSLVSAFMRHLSVLVSTGTPLVDALAALERQTKDPAWSGVLADVRARVEDGNPFSEALAAHPRFFDSVCRSLVRAGESSGKLDVMLRRLSDLTRQQVKARQTLIGAMVYPCVLVFVAINVLVTMMCFVMPRFSGLFKTLDTPLPPTTKILMAASETLVAYWWAFLAVLILIGSGVTMWMRSVAGRRRLDTFAVRAPQVGRLVRALSTARIARLMGTLLESKVPMLECLALTCEASTNGHYVALLHRAEETLTRGEPLSAALGTGGLISPSVCEAVRNAERTGQIGAVLSNMADFLDEENEVVIKSITGLLEPLILIVLGLIVGTVAISMFLPLFDLASTAGGGGPAGGGGTP